MRFRVQSGFVVVAALALVGGCGRKTDPGEQGEPTAQDPAAVVQAPHAKPASKEPTSSFDDAAFHVKTQAHNPYAGGEGGVFGVELRAKAPWHLNQDYPTKITLRAPEPVKLSKVEWVKSDAQQFIEEKAVFEIPFQSAPGKHQVTAELSFAVCTEESCIPEKRSLAVLLEVQ